MMESRQVTKELSDFQEIRDLYTRAFPRREQFPEWLIRMMSKRKGFAYTAYYQEGGISYGSNQTHRFAYQ